MTHLWFYLTLRGAHNVLKVKVKVSQQNIIVPHWARRGTDLFLLTSVPQRGGWAAPRSGRFTTNISPRLPLYCTGDCVAMLRKKGEKRILFNSSTCSNSSSSSSSSTGGGSSNNSSSSSSSSSSSNSSSSSRRSSGGGGDCGSSSRSSSSSSSGGGGSSSRRIVVVVVPVEVVGKQLVACTQLAVMNSKW